VNVLHLAPPGVQAHAITAHSFIDEEFPALQDGAWHATSCPPQ
jgi:hypothetical protein